MIERIPRGAGGRLERVRLAALWGSIFSSCSCVESSDLRIGPRNIKSDQGRVNPTLGRTTKPDGPHVHISFPDSEGLRKDSWAASSGSTTRAISGMRTRRRGFTSILVGPTTCHVEQCVSLAPWDLARDRSACSPCIRRLA